MKLDSAESGSFRIVKSLRLVILLPEIHILIYSFQPESANLKRPVEKPAIGCQPAGIRSYVTVLLYLKPGGDELGKYGRSTSPKTHQALFTVHILVKASLFIEWCPAIWLHGRGKSSLAPLIPNRT